jgi:pimeloyl-ACP methyl ester carboxylesterase
MVTFAQLRDANLQPLADSVSAWRNLVKKLESAEDDYRGKLIKPLRDSRWRGKTASAAMRTLIPFTQYFRVSSTEASAIASVLHSGHAKFNAAQRKLKGAVEEASGLRLSVGEDGSVRIPPISAADAKNPETVKYWERWKLQAQQVHQKLAEAVKEATEADNSISQALGKLSADILDRPNSGVEAMADAKMAAGLAGFDKNNIPPKGVDTPKEAAAWWKGLPEEQRHLMMNAFPEKIGWLNGIPSEDRDEANRASLANRLAQLHADRNLTPSERTELGRLEKLNHQLGKLDQAGKDPYVLGINSRGDDGGRAIVAVGNPDHAKHTAFLVPGFSTNLDTFGSTLDRADRLNAQAGQYADGPVSTIAWLGYDAPESADVAGHGKSAAGAPGLQESVDGIRQAQADAGNTSHLTAIGHSYGSTVVGEAARGGNLHVNDIVAVGSPGMHASHASEFGIGSNHVWSQKSVLDPIPALGSGAGHGPLGLGHGGIAGVAPSDPIFGARQMEPDNWSHTDYWNPGSESIKNQARVIAGRYDAVSPDVPWK